MTVLLNFPHRCTIRRRTFTADAVGGSLASYVNEQTNVECWDQNASDSEGFTHEKVDMRVNHKVYFLVDPAVTERHEILITSRDRVAVATPIVLRVASVSYPDVSSGMGILFRIMAYEEEQD